MKSSKRQCNKVNAENSAMFIKIKSAQFKCPALYKKVLLICFSIIIITGLIVFIFLYHMETEKLRNTCLSKECFKSAAYFKLSMDTSVDPCDDFYKYSCGHWSKEHTAYSNFESISEKFHLATLKFLKENSTPIDPLPIRQSRELYQSCLDIDARNSLGFSSVKKYLSESNLPIIPHYFYMIQKQNSSKDYYENYKFDWIKADVAIKKLFSLDIFVGVAVSNDSRNPQRNIINFGIPDLSSPLLGVRILNWYYYEETKQKNIVIYVVKSMMNNCSLALSDSELEQAADTILNLTKEVDQIVVFLPASHLYDTTCKVDIIQKITDEYLKENNVNSSEIWRPYLNLLFENSTVALDLSKTDFVYLPVFAMEYLKRIALYLAQKPDIYIELYMWWMVLQTMIMHTTTDISTYIFGQQSYISMPKIENDIENICVNVVKNFMEMAVVYGITDKNFLRKTKPKIEQMLDELKQAFQERLNEVDWMDEKTKRETLMKYEAMDSFIGFPPWLFKRGAIDSYYYGVRMDRRKLLENLVGIIKLWVPYQLKSLRKENLKIWQTALFNAHADKHFNSIDVPFAAPSFPFFNLGLQVLEYGAIGVILGHEVTHGVNNIGRNYDRNRINKQWWSDETVRAYDEKTKCFMEQFDKFYFPDIGEYVKGSQTLTENLAVNGGLHISFRAYKNYLKKHAKELKLPGFENYTEEQMFFIAYGNIWCENTKPEILKKQITENNLAPNIAQVLINLQNSEEFAEAFKCPVGSKMNPIGPKCRIW